MRKLIGIFLIATSAGWAQYAASASGSTTAAAEINGKPNWQISAGSCTTLNGTAGKDLCYDSTNAVYYACKTTGTPCTWIKLLDLGQLAALATGILKNTTGTGVPSIAVAGDFPTLNQNTTGTAANLSGTPALPNGTTATTQSQADGSTKLATTNYVDTGLAGKAASTVGSVFGGSTGSTIASGASPVFSLADVSVKSPIRFEISPIVNVTGPTITNKSAGAKFDIAITTDGTHAWSWNSIVSDNVCPVYTAAAATTVASLEIGVDGTTVHGVGCQLLINGLTFFGATVSASSTAPGSGNLDCRMTSSGLDCYDGTNHWIQQKSGLDSFCSDAGSTDTYACTLAPAPAALVTNGHYRFIANTANTGAATINFNSLGAKAIKKAAGGVTTDLSDNDIRAGQAVDVVYDGTNMQMQSTLGNAAAGGTATQSYTIPLAGAYTGSGGGVQIGGCAWGASNQPAAVDRFSSGTPGLPYVDVRHGSDSYIYCWTVLPANWVSSTSFTLQTFGGSTSGNALMSIATACPAAGADLSAASVGTAATGTITMSGTSFTQESVTLTPTASGTCAANGLMLVRVGRVGTSGSDTSTGAIYMSLLQVLFTGN